jgi:MinD-like ATPase involved in chromosome partitioning or flagellar assembly
MSGSPSAPLKRREIHPGPLVDGRPVRDDPLGRLGRRVAPLFVSRAEREEAALEDRLRTHPGVTRPNTVALISPKGGVGKTTSTFAVANLLCSHLKLRAIAVDANPDFGTLAHLAPDDARADRDLDDLLRDADHLHTAAELGAYVSRLPTGLHVLGAPRDPTIAARLEPDRYGELVAFLACFYEVVLLDLGTGVVGPLASFAVERADQVVLVTTPEWVTATVVLGALSHLARPGRTTVVINKARVGSAEVGVVEQRFRAEHLLRTVTIPYDERLAAMLDTGTYALGALRSPTRLAIKRLGLAVAERLV